MKKRNFTMLLLCMVITAGIFAGCGNTEKDKDDSELKDSDVTTDNIENEEENQTLSKFSVSETDYYNTLSDFNYMTIVLYYGSSDGEKKPVAVVYDMESSMKECIAKPFDTFVSSGDFAYRFAISNDNYAIYDCFTLTSMEDCLTHVAFFETKEDKNGNSYLSYVENPDLPGRIKMNYYSIVEREKDYSYDRVTDTYANITNEDNSWYSTVNLTRDNACVDSIFLRIAQSGSYNYYVNVPLKETVLYNDNTVSAINENFDKITSGEVLVLDSLSLSANVEQSYGQEYDISLDDTIFYQDILAEKISEDYGLNLKDKSYYNRTENTYIRYIKRDDEIAVYVDFQYEKEDYDYFYIDEYDEEDVFEYTDFEGNKYSYINSDESVYIFKNEEFAHTVMNISKSDENMTWYEAVGVVFGVRNS